MMIDTLRNLRVPGKIILWFLVAVADIRFGPAPNQPL